MSIQAPQGILNIPNATLRVGKLAVDEVVGADTILNTVARNTILLVDGDTYHENKNWDLKLPNAWAGEFECNTASAGNYSEFNFYNEGASSNAQGYNLTFNDTAVQLRYDGTLLTSGTLPSTVTGTGVKKVRLMFERTILSVTVDGTLIFTHDDTGGPRPRVYSTTAGGFLNFFTDGGALKNLKIVNEKWISDGTSNIAYVGGGEVAVGKALAFNRVSNVSQIKVDSNVVTEFPRSKKLIKYPRVALTADDNLSTSGYKASVSSLLTGSGAFKAFDVTGATSYWHSQYPYYTFVTGTYNPGQASQGTGTPSGTLPTTELISGHQGEWIKLQMPKKIKLEEVRVYATNRAAGTNIYQMPKDIAIAGSNDGTNWYLVDSGTLRTGIRESYGMASLPVTTSSYYSYLALIVKTIDNQGANYSATEIANIEYYGVPEYDPEAHGTDVVVKSYPNVPNTDWLEVYYDGQDYTQPSDFAGLGGVVDKAGGDQDGTAGTGVGFDTTYKAFVFDGSEYGVISDELPSTVTGAYVHSMSLWFKHSGTGNTLYTLVHIGDVNDSQSVMSDLLVYDTGKLRFGFYDNDSDTPDGIITLNQWYHVVATYSGGTGNAHSRKIYVNGKEIPLTLSGASNANSLSLPSDPMLYLGSQQGSIRLTGSIANFRLFNRALTSDEIYQLYAYQKEYFGHGDLSMTLKAGRLGIGTSEPRAALDVRGDLTVSDESYFNNVGVTGRTTTRRMHEINFAIPPIADSSHQQFFWLAQFSELQWDYSEYLRFEYNLHFSAGFPQHNRGVTSGGYAIIATRSQGATGTGTQYDNEDRTVRRVEYSSYRGFGEGPDFYYVRNRTRSKGYLVAGFRSSRVFTPSSGSRLTGTIQYNGNLDNIDTFNGTVYKHGVYAVTGGVGSHSTLFPSVINDSKFVAQSGDTVTLHEATGSTTYFTGQHTTYIEDLPDLTNHENNNGLIVSSNKNDYIHLTNHKIRGKEAITQDESLPITSLSTRQNDKTCFGVMSCKPFNEYSEKRFCVVNSLGEGAIWVLNTNGNLEAGDYITTSNVTGYGQKQDGDILRNYTVAKITMDCNFNPVSRPIKEILRSENGEYILDEDDQIQWTDTNETEMQYNIRYVDANSTLISQDEYTTKLSEGENVYIAAYVGCTYHCG